MRYIPIWLLVLISVGGCTINKDILFKTPLNYAYDELPDTLEVESRITTNNFITMNFFTGDGHALIEQGIGGGVLSGNAGGNNVQGMNRNQLTYLVDKDGTVKLPVLGRVKIAGLSMREAELKLEGMYSEYYNDPFVILRVNNNRVIVSPGGGGQAQVITLINANTTLLEALALAGGIAERGVSSKIKLLRQDLRTKERTVYEIDLSTIDGLNKADIIVQPNDIIYVQPLPLIASELVREIAPILTLISTVGLIIALLR